MPSDISSSSSLTVEREARPVVIRRHDAVIAATENALIVREGGRPPVYYVPRADVYMEQLTESGDHAGSGRPGGRRYWSVIGSGGGVEAAAWMLDAPQGEEAALKDHIGFDPEPFNITAG